MDEIPFTPPPSKERRLYASVDPDLGGGTFEGSPLNGIVDFNSVSVLGGPPATVRGIPSSVMCSSRIASLFDDDEISASRRE